MLNGGKVDTPPRDKHQDVLDAIAYMAPVPSGTVSGRMSCLEKQIYDPNLGTPHKVERVTCPHCKGSGRLCEGDSIEDCGVCCENGYVTKEEEIEYNEQEN